MKILWSSEYFLCGQNSESLKNNSTIISTFRVQADECDRLWVIDSGLEDILGKHNQQTPPTIIIFDLKTDKLIHRYTIPKNQIKGGTILGNIVVDSDSQDCDNSFAYIPDFLEYGLIVYSLKDDKSWRIKHNFFHFDPLSGDFNIGGVNFQWADGIFGLAIGDHNQDGTRNVWFHSFASTKEFEVSNKILQNETHVTGRNYYYDFKLIGDRGLNGQSTTEAYDKKTQTIFYTQLNKDGVGCWNTNKPYTPENAGLVDSDSNALVFPNDLKVDQNGNLWVLSDRLSQFVFKSLDHEDVNYRVMTAGYDQPATLTSAESKIISTFRIQADECDRLWVMDSGLADILGKSNQHTPPTLVIFDLKTDQLKRRFEIPKQQIRQDTSFANIAVDSDSRNCDNTFAYIPDLLGFGLVVYSLKQNKSWRIEHNFFHFDPLNGDFNVGGVNFQWSSGIFALAIGDENKNGEKDVWFHSCASTKEFVVSNKILQNETHVTTAMNYYYDFNLIGDRGPKGQSTSEAYDKKTKTIFYTLLNKDGIGCWNINKSYTPENAGLVDSDNITLVFPNDLKIDKKGNLWVLSDRMPQFLYTSLDHNDFNYRIMGGETSKVIEGTSCEE